MTLYDTIIRPTDSGNMIRLGYDPVHLPEGSTCHDPTYPLYYFSLWAPIGAPAAFVFVLPIGVPKTRYTR